MRFSPFCVDKADFLTLASGDTPPLRDTAVTLPFPPGYVLRQ
jgi:hypothetical protein